MRRLFRISFLSVMFCVLGLSVGRAAEKPEALVGGRVASDEVRVFTKDSVYKVYNGFNVAGTLIIEPGTTLKFAPNGRVVISTGGRIIADGYAHANYDMHPLDINTSRPISTVEDFKNHGWANYGSMGYFLYQNTIKASTVKEKTVNSDKANYVFDVILDTLSRTMRSGNGNLYYNGVDNGYIPYDPANPNKPNSLGKTEVVIPFEKAIMFANSGIATWNDPTKLYSAWERADYDDTINIRLEQIKFVGQSTTNFTREKGHIVIMPGARAAFFRNCSFENMRKDITVDTVDYYANNPELNANMIKLTNGKGGAITTFSSRTWLLDCEFSNNLARNAAGALQILQAPEGLPTNAKYNTLANYPKDKNPALTEPNGNTSLYNKTLKRVDNLDEQFVKELLTDEERQAYDDARLSVFLGRMRNLTFENNKARLSGITLKPVGSVLVEVDDENSWAKYPQSYGNYAKGGAVLIAGREATNNTTKANQIEVGLGINNRINIAKIDGSIETIEHATKDAIRFTNNTADNYQSDSRSLGSMGGAIYLGANTSLIVSANFTTNTVSAPYYKDSSITNGDYAKGGAIYQEGNSYGRLQVRGDDTNTIKFDKNVAYRGGAIYVAASINAEVMSPVIGGADNTPTTRNYGKLLSFNQNISRTLGGAIYTERNMRINGAGGLQGTTLNYSDRYRVVFNENLAAFGGGAIAINLPDNAELKDANHNSSRNIHFARALFTKNKVGTGAIIENSTDVTTNRQEKIIGGGAIFSKYADLNVIKGVEFNENSVMNGNGAAIHVGVPSPFSKKFFVSDLDSINYNTNDYSGNDVPTGVTSTDAQFTTGKADVRMLTRFINNKADANLADQNGNGMTQVQTGTLITRKNINAITFLDENNGFAVGDQGTIIKLSEAGDVWEYQDYPATNNLTSIYFTTDRIGFIGGDQGLILKTTDAGATWNVVSLSGSGANINAISFVNSNTGFAVGNAGVIMKNDNVNDPNSIWERIQTVTVNRLNDIAFTGINKGLAVGDRGTILVTENGGTTWNALNNPYLRMYNLESIYFTDATTGYIAGNGVVLKTINSGQTWSVSHSSTKRYTKVVFTGLNTGYAYDSEGTLAKTIDAGATWTHEKVYINDSTVALASIVNDVYYLNQNTALIASNRGMMFRTTNNGEMWNRILAADSARESITRYHPTLGIAENGIGLGGAIYIVDSISTRSGSDDAFRFNRVRFQNNTAFSGAAIYSDNFNLKLALTRSLAVGNKATSQIGMNQNSITGPAFDQDKNFEIDPNGNLASSDLVGAIFYGEVSGPEPFANTSIASNSIYGNDSRFLVRLPDAPNTKGVLAGRNPGPGGVVNLKGNYWGKTEANVNLFVYNYQDPGYDFDKIETFFIDKCDKNYLSYVFGKEGSVDTLAQGPFESNGFFTTPSTPANGVESKTRYEYASVALRNISTSQDTADVNTIPEKFLMSGRIYDLYDKGTDIKVADYSSRRMSPIEDFAVGIPPVLKDSINDKADKYLIRWTRDPFVAEDPNYPMVAALQSQWVADPDLINDTKGYYHPIGWPLFLEAKADYTGDNNVNNQDELMVNESVFFVINENTTDFIRVSAKQLDNISETLRARVEFIPDLATRKDNGASRRMSENLLALDQLHMLNILDKIAIPENEDAAALQGRKYYGPNTKLGSTDTSVSNNLYVNRDWFAPSNGTNHNATYFAGERYSALPVNVGDIVSVVSRTILHREGTQKAIDGALRFQITKSTKAPVFTGDVEKLKVQSKDPIFNNAIYVTEDREYPCPNPSDLYSNMGDAAGRDSILSVTGKDYSKFYDPRSVTDSLKNIYSSLYYRMTIDNNTAASRWLKTTTLAATKGTKDGAAGYMVLRGTPMNPYIVPGGEMVKVRIENFAPSVRTQDSLDLAFYGKNDTLSKFMYIYPSYFNAPIYDMTIEANTDNKPLRARYLQQDTILNTANYYAEYQFRVFVVDSTPEFVANFDDDDRRVQPELFYQDMNYVPTEASPKYQDTNKVRVIYVPTKFRNGFAEMTEDGKIIANLTDKLRLQADFNTDDEAEDYWAGVYGWDFKYGKTAYGFNNVAMRDTNRIVVDLPNQTRPNWMSNNFMYQYNSETVLDDNAYNFTNEGKLNIRVAGDVARRHLGVDSTYAKASTLDTVFTVVVNDGHSGMTVLPVDVYVNVAPKIMNTSLANATEDVDYNPTLTDTTRMIKIYDPNQDQEHRYELLYANDPRLNLAKDPAFPEAGFHNLVGKATTPEWLKINPMTGMLYGKPTVENVTEDPNRLDTVTVLVWDKVRQDYSRTNFKSLKSNGTNFFAVGDNGAVVKIDPATSIWSIVNIPSEVSTFNLNDIAFADASNGFIVGNHGLILKTIDGGSTWTKSLVDNYKHYNFTTVEFVDAQNGIVAGENGKMFKTTDAGASWTPITEPTMTNQINKIKMLDANTFVAGSTQGKCFISSDAGASISGVVLPDGASEIVDIYEVSDSKLLAVTTNAIYASTDKGATWIQNDVELSNLLGAFNFTSIGNFESNNSDLTSTKADVVFATASINIDNVAYTRIFKSTDAGTTFGEYRVNEKFDMPYNNINDLLMYKPNIGYMVGEDGSIVRFVTEGAFVSIAQVGANENDMLSDVKVMTLKVNTISHKPEVLTIARAECIEKGIGSFIDKFTVKDKDLLRPNSSEVITIQILSPNNGNWTVSPATMTGTTKNDTIQLIYKSVAEDVLDADGRLHVEVLVKDKSGNEVIVPFTYKYSDTPDFTSYVTVSNNKGQSQVLEWGTAEYSNAKPVSTGDGNTIELQKYPANYLGQLDQNYCEYEIPPVPTSMVFDARWNVPTRTGILRNIQPRSNAGTQDCFDFVYKATFQSGGNDPSSSTGDFVPLKISWRNIDIPSADDARNPAGASFYMQDANSKGNLFNVNMANPKKASKMGDVIFIDQDSVFTIQISQLTVKGFNIVYTCRDILSVNDNDILAGIQSVGPNPVESASKVTFGVSNYGNVRLELYDAIGNLVNTIANSDYAPGVHTVDFDAIDFSGNKLATGSYTVRMVSGTEVSTYQVKVVR